VKRSDTCRRADGGFTLIELVIAIAIVGLGLTIAVPRLTGWLDRLTSSIRQQQFEDALAELGRKARHTGRTLVLHSTNTARNAPSDVGGSSTAQPPIELPSNWTLTVEPPIAFRYDGLCTGGTVHLNYPAGERSYRLLAPYCRLEPL
jgi:prepilin-type N-terminal cleavage/methylation domain-containing protein